MAEQDRPRAVNCPSCGAPLTFSGRRSKCQFCGVTVEWPEEPPFAAPPAFSPADPPSDLTARRQGCRRLLLLLGVSLLVAGALAIFLMKPATAPGVLVKIFRTVDHRAIVVPTDRAGPPDLLLFTYDTNSRERFLSYFDGERRALRWDSPPVSIQTYHQGVVVGGRRAYLVDQTRLLALDLADGALAWQAELSDTILTYSCHDCLRLVGDFVIVLTQDGILQAFEAAAGRPAWSVRLNETPRDLWEVQGHLVVLDREDPQNSRSVALQFRDPATGQVVRRIPGRCQTQTSREATLRIYDPTVVLSPAGDALYLLYGSRPGCVQRWDPATGQMLWQTVAADDDLDSLEGRPVLVDGVIYAGTGGRIIAIDAATGELRLLAQEQDYQLVPRAAGDGMLLAAAERTRGSRRYEVWGLNAATGQVRWRYIPQDERPLEASGSSSEQAFSWQLTREGLFILHLLPDPPTLLVERLDPRTGQTSAPTASSLDGKYWEGLTWGEGYAWLIANNLYVVDLGAEKVLYSWP